MPRVFAMEQAVKLPLLLEASTLTSASCCAGSAALLRRVILASGGFAWLLLVGYVVDLEILVVLLVRVVLLWTPGPCPTGPQSLF